MHRLAVECLLGSTLGDTTYDSEENRIRQREKLNHNAVTMEASVDPAGSFRAEIALPNCPKSW